jgi:hypothetical protein
VPAAGLPDRVARYPQPLVIGRRGQHAVEQLAVAAVEVLALAQGRARVLDAGREGVAQRLELAQVQRLAVRREGGHPGGDLDPRESLGGERRETVLEAADLAPQLGAGAKLVAAYSERRWLALSAQELLHALRV